MIREHKYRAWDKTDKVMYYGIEKGIDFDDGSHYDFKNFLGYQEKEDYHEWEVMQYAGLKDKNGKEIYEGDIIAEDTSYPLEVYWMGVAWGIRWKDKRELQEEIISLEMGEWNEKENKFVYFEVIGDIYENPELLEVK